jgi:hypothetical protein
MRTEYFDLLKNEFTFGFNRIFRLFVKFDWRPSFYVIVDHNIAEGVRDELLASSLDRIWAASELRVALGDDPRIFYFGRKFHTSKTELPEFTSNMRDPIVANSTVTYDAMQIAWHLGFREFYTLGIDGDYKLGNIRDVTVEASDRKLAYVDASNAYFAPELLLPNERTVLPQQLEQWQSYCAARGFIEANGGSIYNAAPDSPLDVFERKPIHELF